MSRPEASGSPGGSRDRCSINARSCSPAVQARVVDADGGPCGQLDREFPVAVAERLAALRPGELREPHDRVVGDHRHGQRGLHEAALLGGHALRPGGAQGVRAGRVERVVVDRADLDGLPGAAEGGPRDGAGEGDAAQFGAAVGETGRGLVPGQQALVEVDGGEVAEAGDDDVEEFAGRGLQVQGVPMRAPASLSSARLRRAAAASRAAARRAVMSVPSQATPMGRPLPLCTR